MKTQILNRTVSREVDMFIRLNKRGESRDGYTFQPIFFLGALLLIFSIAGCGDKSISGHVESSFEPASTTTQKT